MQKSILNFVFLGKEGRKEGIGAYVYNSIASIKEYKK